MHSQDALRGKSFSVVAAAKTARGKTGTRGHDKHEAQTAAVPLQCHQTHPATGRSHRTGPQKLFQWQPSLVGRIIVNRFSGADTFTGDG